MSIPVRLRVWPALQEYVATELYVVVETDTIPFAWLLRVPQSTTAQGKVTKTVTITSNFTMKCLIATHYNNFYYKFESLISL